MKETKFQKDGRSEMERNPKPKRYWVVIDRKSNEAVEAYRDGEIEREVIASYRSNKKERIEVQWYKDDKALSEATGLEF